MQFWIIRTQETEKKVTFDPKAEYNFELEKTLDEKVLIQKCARAITKGEHTEITVDVTNTDRAFGTILGAEITRQTKQRLLEDTIVVNCHGAGGQSFGAFIPKGLTLNLTGDSNDYFGKGLSGGKLIVKVSEKSRLSGRRKYHRRKRCSVRRNQRNCFYQRQSRRTICST